MYLAMCILHLEVLDGFVCIYIGNVWCEAVLLVCIACSYNNNDNKINMKRQRFLLPGRYQTSTCSYDSTAADIMKTSSGDIIMLRLHAMYLYFMHCMHDKKLKGKYLQWTINRLMNTSKVNYNNYSLFSIEMLETNSAAACMTVCQNVFCLYAVFLWV